jgi:hypothetical protein
MEVRQRVGGIRRCQTPNRPSQPKSPTLEAMARAFGEPEEFGASRNSTDTADGLAHARSRDTV